MAADSKIGITIQSTDQASAALQKVAKNLDTLGSASESASQNIAKGGDAIRAAMSAANGSVTGALGAVKGMTGAIVGMGASMTAALPIAAAVAAAIWVITKAIKAHKEAQEESARQTKEANDRLLEQTKIVEKQADAYAKLAADRKTEAELNARIEGTNKDPIAAKMEELNAARKRLAEVSGLIDLARSQFRMIEDATQQKLDEMGGVNAITGYNPLTGQQIVQHFGPDEETMKGLSDQVDDNVKRMTELRKQESDLLTEKKNLTLTEKALTAEFNRLVEETKNSLQSQLKALQQEKERIESQLQEEALRNKIKDKEAELQGYKDAYAESTPLSGTFKSGSHATSLLLDRLSGNGLNSYNNDIRANSKKTVDELKTLNEQLAEVLKKRDDREERLREIAVQMAAVNIKLENLEAI